MQPRMCVQTAEYLLEHGLLDLVVPRSFLKGALYEMMDLYKANEPNDACLCLCLGINSPTVQTDTTTASLTSGH